MPRNASLMIADRLFNRPLFIHPAKANVALWVVRDKVGAFFDVPDQAPIDPAEPGASRFIGTNRREERPYGLVRVEGGVGIITIEGSLVNRGAWIGTDSGVVSYEGIAAQIRDAAADPEVSSIILDIDSPGGEATGMFNLAKLIRSVEKPVVAVVDDMAASAGYGLASAADEIVVSPTSIVGSIGVVLLHIDRSVEMEKKGWNATLIYAGEHKVDGNEFGPLPKNVAADLQREVMKFYDRFLETVADGRGARLDAAAARATEARVYIGTEAVEAGLADRIGSIDDVLADLTQGPTPGRATRGTYTMSAIAKEPAGVPQADHDKAVQAAFERGKAEGIAAGRTEGEAAGRAAQAKDDKARYEAIMGLDEAKGRETQAVAAYHAGLTMEQAKAMLATTPKGAPGLAARMERTASEEESLNNPEPGAKADRIKSGWGKAVSSANQRFA